MKTLDSKARRLISGSLAAVLFLFAGVGILRAGETNNPVFARRAGAELQRARAQFQLNTNDTAAAWQFARACFKFNDFVTNNAARTELAGQGIAACRQLLASESNSVPGHYYLAVELGLLADTKRNMAAFKMVREMEREFKMADNLDSHFDYAGPSRCLGLLYRDAPGWPISVGSRHKARDWLEQAAELAPGYPDNQLNLVESYWQWKDRDASSNALQKLDDLWPAARTNFAGEAWEQNWNVWSARRDVIREKLAETSPSRKASKDSQN